MKIIAFIEQAEVIEKILKHLGLWLAHLPGLGRAQPGQGAQPDYILLWFLP
jgi:hypothetical protein